MLIRNSLRVASLTATFVFAANLTNAADILGIGDPILAFDDDQATDSASPDGEQAPNAIDDDAFSKYLNFATTRTGFIVTPTTTDAIQSFVITTGNDADGRDPTSYELFGTNDAITSQPHLNGRDENWTLVSAGDLTLPAGDGSRNMPGDLVTFSNANSYSSYKMIFPEVRTEGFIMQFSEIEMFASLDGSGSDLTMPGDPIIPIQDIDIISASDYPGAQSPQQSYDNVLGTKYLNFGGQNSGFIVTPQVGPTVVDSFQITTGDDTPERDPAAYTIYGTNDPVVSTDNGFGDAETWTEIQSGTLTLPEERSTAGGVIPITGNTAAYTSYKVQFTELKDNGFFMQIGEFELFTPTQATLTVDRQTGEVVLEATETITFDSIDVQSLFTNALDASEWDSFTDGGTNTDPNDTWTEDSTSGSLLSETGDNDGFTLTAGSTLSLGEIWRAVPPEFEDIRVVLIDDGGLAVGVDIQYVGTESIIGDYSGNGSIGPEDWPFFRDVLGGQYDGQTAGAAYLGGDLDGDFDSDLDDFNIFLDIFFEAGNTSLTGAVVPEPSAAIVIVGALIAAAWYRSRSIIALLAGVTVLQATQVEAQTFTLETSVTPIVTIPVGQENETPDSGPANLFDDAGLLEPLNDDLFIADYNGAGVVSEQYAGLGGDPKVVFLDYGSSISPNWFAYAQRSGAIATADRVGKFEFWFSNTDFGGAVPNTDPDAMYEFDVDDDRVYDAILRPFPLGSDGLNGQYVAVRFSELAIDSPFSNIGGHELRFLSGPSDVVLTVNRATGELTLSNDGPNAQPIEMQAYEIESQSAALDPNAFNGIAGDVAGFNLGNGLGDGWETTGGSGFRLLEANFFAADNLPTGVSDVSLGNALTTLSADDITFTWTNSFGDVFDGRVEYIGVAPELDGDYNGDGMVNLADYTVWRDNLGGTATLPGDTTPGNVTVGDYTVWKNNFGLSGAAALTKVSPTNVPEPAAALLLLLGAASALTLRRSAFV